MAEKAGMSMRVLLIAPHWLFVYEAYGELSKAIQKPPVAVSLVVV
jgi:hypothetical protein